MKNSTYDISFTMKVEILPITEFEKEKRSRTSFGVVLYMIYLDSLELCWDISWMMSPCHGKGRKV